MRILIVSDLHLGDKKAADDFGRNDKRFVEWVRRQKVDEVYLNGDIYELWQFKSQEIRNAHFLLTRLFQSGKFYHLRGNHDYQLMGPLTKSLKTKSGKLVLISHGFQNDRMMTNPFTRAFIWFIGQTLEKIWPNIDNADSYRKKKAGKTRTMRNTRKYADKMLKRYDIVFCAHTHHPGIWRRPDGKVYANSGPCINNAFHGILFETLTDEIKLV